MRTSLLIIFFSLTRFSSAQQAVVYPFPSMVQVSMLSPSIPNSDRDEDNFTVLNSPYVENFHPIGWSDDGKAAFLVWGEGADDCHLGIKIYDAVKDTTVAEWKEDMTGSNILSADQLPAFWSREKDTISKLLHKYNIVPSKADFQNFPFEKNKSQYSIEYFINPFENSTRYFSGISGTFITSNEKGNDSLHVSMNGFHAVDIQPTSVWFSPDGKFALLVGYYEMNYSEVKDTPHSFYYFFCRLR